MLIEFKTVYKVISLVFPVAIYPDLYEYYFGDRCVRSKREYLNGI